MSEGDVKYLRRLAPLSAAAALLAAPLGAAPALAAAPQAKSPAPGFARMMLGSVEITALSDGTTALPMRQLLQGPKSEIDRALTADRLGEPVETSFNAFLVNDGTKLVLIDAGAGTLFSPSLGKLAANLRAAGYEPDQVDEIYITHFHVDHVGGLVTAGGERAFRNAVVRADRRESDFWLSKENLAKASAANKPFFEGAQKALAPYVAAGAYKPFTGATSLADGIRAVPSAGHTPGHTSYVLASGTHRVVFIGDLVHAAAVQFPDPKVTIAFDTVPREAEQQREALFAEAARTGEWVAAAHIAFPAVGTIERSGSGYRWVPLNYSPSAAL